MTASEFKYLLVASELNENDGVKMAAVAKRLGVSKVSVCRAVERLSADGYIDKPNKKICLTEKGKLETAEYLLIVNFIANKLERYCNTPKSAAFDEAIGAACALGETSRKGVLSFVKNDGAI